MSSPSPEPEQAAPEVDARQPLAAEGSIAGVLGGLGTNVLGTVIGYAAGVALARALLPEATQLGQESWKVNPSRVPDAALLAAGVAQGQVDPAEAAAWARAHGFDSGPFEAMVSVANVGPALGYAFEAWRRGALSDGEFRTALKRTGLEPEWFDAMQALRENPLDPAQLATAIHRNIIPGPDLIVTEPPTTAGRVPQVPQSPIDPVSEAEWSGIARERLRVLVGITGLPLSLGEMLQLLNRGIVTEDDFKRAVAQSNLRNEYMDVALGLRRRLLTPHEYEELALRGWIDRDKADAGAAMSGMEKEDARLLFEMLGRPLNIHQVTTGLARGGSYGGYYRDVPEPYLEALQQSNVRPEWGNIAYANRYTLPGAFVVRRLLQDGVLTEQEGETLFLQSGWPPDLARKAAQSYANSKPTGGTSHTEKAQTQLWNTTHRAYVASEATDSEASAALTAAGVPGDEIGPILGLWKHERDTVRRELSPKEIVKAVAEKRITSTAALTRLLELGYTKSDADLILAE